MIINYKIPFLLIQGTNEYTTRTSSGSMAIMDDEKRHWKIFLVITIWKKKNVTPNYNRVPYWGYTSDEKESIYPVYLDYGIHRETPTKRSGVEW